MKLTAAWYSASGPWYDASSALFWATVVLIILTIAAVIIGILTWRSAKTRRALLCSVISRTRLLAAPKPMRGDLEVRYEREKLEDPYVIALEISNVGKGSISSDSFDKDRGVIFDVGVQILKILTVEYEPGSAPRPTIRADGNTFELMPELIKKDERIKVSILTEGPVRDADLTLNPFGDVDIEVRDRESWENRRARRRFILWFVPTAAIILSAVITFAFANSGPNPITQLNLYLRSSALHDGTLPGKSNCEQGAKPLADAGKSALRDTRGKQAGYVELIHSATCSTIWAKVTLTNSATARLKGNIILITMTNKDNKSSPYPMILNGGTTGFGTMLSNSISCVFAQVSVIAPDGNQVGPKTITKCM